MVEAFVLIFGLAFAQRIGCNCLLINNNNLEVIEMMNMRGHYLGGAAAIYDDNYHLVCDFTIARFKQCSRDANKVAHELAMLGKLSVMLDWFEELVGKSSGKQNKNHVYAHPRSI